MSEPPLHGSCGCGAVTFTVAEPLGPAMYCHCTRCQKRTGAAVQASAKVVPGSVALLSGDGDVAEWAPPGGMRKQFCQRCGSHLFAADPESGEIRAVRLGAIDGDPGVRPTAHQFVAYAAPWESVRDDDLPRFDERIPAT